MLRKMLVMATLGMTMAACGADETMDQGEQADELVAGKADGVAQPLGRYQSAGAVAPGNLVSLTLSADGAFAREELVECFAAPCNPLVQTGTFKYTRSGTHRYLRFYDAQGDFMDRYEYKLAASKLSLRLIGASAWHDLVKAVAAAVELGPDDDGRTVEVTAGQDVVVALPSNPTTGYGWEVVRTDRSFGYPATTDFVASSGAIGAGGTARLTWKTGAPFTMGTHTVELGYRRTWETVAPARTFRFTVHVSAR